MLQRVCLALSVCAVAFALGVGLSQAGWSRLELTTAHDASSLVISVKNKHKSHDDDDSDGLTQCTLQTPNGGMGCVAPAKLVCQKMKNGKKCCACVGGPSKATTTPPPAAPTTQLYHCLSSAIPGLGTINCTVAKGSEDEAYGYCLRDAQARYPNVQVPAGALKCNLVK